MGIVRHSEAVAWLLALGCSALGCSALGCSASDAPQIPCVDGDVRCGKHCDATAMCPQGLYCTPGGVCAKECVSGKTLCAGGAACMPTGMCPPPVMTMTSAGHAGTGGGAGGRGAGAAIGAGGSGLGGAGASTECGDTMATPMRVTPNVILVVDQSGSMNEDFGNGSRWSALHDSLLAQPNGLITALQGQVNFGLAMYSARADDGPVQGQCPLIASVQPAPNNRASIAAMYDPAVPIDETPTGDAIDAVSQQLVPANTDLIAMPYVFILATDGEPDSCADPNPDGMTRIDAAKQKVIDAVTRANQRGIRTYVISVGDDLSQDHQRAVANAGVGHQAGTPDAPFWRAGDDQSLRAALTAIVGTQISCDIALGGNVSGDPCRGRVMLQGSPVACNDPNGWALLDPAHIRLSGSACQSFGSNPNAVLAISFPCNGFVQ